MVSLFSEGLKAREEVAHVNILENLRCPELQHHGRLSSLNLSNQMLKVSYRFVLGVDRCDTPNSDKCVCLLSPTSGNY